MFLIYIPEIAAFLKATLFCNKKKKGTTNDSFCKQNDVFAGLVKVIIFFSQTEPLIKVGQNDLHYTHYMAKLIRSYHSIIKNVLNFQVSMLCPFQTLSAVTKVIVIAVLPMVSPVNLVIITTSFWLYKRFRRSVPVISRNALIEKELTFSSGVLMISNIIRSNGQQ